MQQDALLKSSNSRLTVVHMNFVCDKGSLLQPCVTVTTMSDGRSSGRKCPWSFVAHKALQRTVYDFASAAAEHLPCSNQPFNDRWVIGVRHAQPSCHIAELLCAECPQSR